jgi:hypothetical protein
MPKQQSFWEELPKQKRFKYDHCAPIQVPQIKELYRRTDGKTSKAAAQKIYAKLSQQHKQVLEAFELYGKPATARSLEKLGLDYYMVQRRIPELRRMFKLREMDTIQEGCRVHTDQVVCKSCGCRGNMECGHKPISEHGCELDQAFECYCCRNK